MFKEVLKQMLPFFILLAVLWLAAEILERSFSGGPSRISPTEASPARESSAPE
ncbi:MAG: hypothetical protein PF795_03730 [Kiritimatiellae bacterium]|jgi:hypothetical protein|nr:hypothetical protein [Kiritimatiellia bacterium]